jgi:hypothetical protein
MAERLGLGLIPLGWNAQDIQAVAREAVDQGEYNGSIMRLGRTGGNVRYHPISLISLLNSNLASHGF